MTVGWWGTSRTSRSISWARRATPARRKDSCGSLSARAAGDDDFQRHVQFSAVPESFQRCENFRGGLEGAAKAVALAKHEHTRAVRIGRRRRHGNMFEQNPRRGGEERLLFLSPGHKCGATAGF